ncbi:MAG TPA: NAD(P)-dependent alcohol dehydrogenase [Mycobacteriales bacterium]
MSATEYGTEPSASGSPGGVRATAALLEEVGAPLQLAEVDLGAPAEGEILVRMRGVGICHTDLSARDGIFPVPLPAVLGHEGSGVVEAVGAGVEKLRVGDHVALSFDHCGECSQCSGGHPAYCDAFAPLNYFGTRLDGSVTMHRGEDEVYGNWFGQSSFATHAIASVRNAVKVPNDLPLELLGPLGCGFQTGAGSVLNVMRVDAGEGIIIFGLGAVGLGALMAAKAVGCDPIIGVDLNPERLAIATELGATHTIDPTETEDFLWRVQELAAPGLHYSFDAVGAGPVIRQALESLRTAGHCVTVGFQGLEHEITIDQGHLLLGRQLSGVIEGDAEPGEFIPRLIELHRAGKFPFDRLVKTFAFDQINEAMAAAESGEVVKPVLVFP